jgi:two-component system, response regulator YesN
MPKYKLIIVDDDNIIRRGLSQNIAWAEHDFELVGTAGDGETALQLVEEGQPDIILSDIKMPFMDGLALSKAVKELYPHTQIILLTGYEEFEFAREALKLRVFDYLLKFTDYETLLQTVKRAAVELERNRPPAENPLIPAKPRGLIGRAMRLVEQSYTNEELSLPQIAHALHVSPTYLSQLFKEKAKINFTDFLLQVRMEKAMQLLRTEDLKTYQVAHQVGYPNPQYFSVLFKKYTGFSPSEYKEQAD